MRTKYKIKAHGIYYNILLNLMMRLQNLGNIKKIWLNKILWTHMLKLQNFLNKNQSLVYKERQGNCFIDALH